MMAETAAESLARFDDDLVLCGVTDATLPARDREALDRDGFTVLPDLLGAAQLETFRSVFEASPGTGTAHVTDLASRGVDFVMVAAHPAVLAAVRHVLGAPFRLFQFSGRDPAPGFGLQGLHTDWLPRRDLEPYSVATALWMLDEFRADNGATRMVPGSHRRTGTVPRDVAVPASRHPDETLVVGREGSAIVFNGHVWHAGSRNESGNRRRAFQIQYALRGGIRAPEEASAVTLPDGVAEPVRRVLRG